MGRETMLAKGAACCSVRAHPDTANPRARKTAPPNPAARSTAKKLPANSAPNRKTANTRQDQSLHHYHQQPGDHLREQQRRRIERGRQQAAQDALTLHGHEAEGHAEQPQLHDRHADDPRHQEVDVPEIPRRHGFVFQGNDPINSAQRKVHFVNARPKEAQTDLGLGGPAGVI